MVAEIAAEERCVNASERDNRRESAENTGQQTSFGHAQKFTVRPEFFNVLFPNTEERLRTFTEHLTNFRRALQTFSFISQPAVTQSLFGFCLSLGELSTFFERFSSAQNV
jgi:hypothetical protein